MYTADSIAALENALTAGEIVYENTKATAEQIAQATQAILDAINNLSREIDKDDLLAGIMQRLEQGSLYGR